jgi:hypothetical protein
MNEVTDSLRTLTIQVRNTVTSGDTRGLRDADLLDRLRAAEEAARALDSIRLAAIGEIDDRSRKELGSGRLSLTLGCRNSNELVQRVTQASCASIGKQLRLTRAIRERTDLAGNPLPAHFPDVAAAVQAGTVGFDTAHLIAAELDKTVSRAGRDAVGAAEAELVAAATGASTEAGGVPCIFDDIRIQVGAWRAVLDPDGEEPKRSPSNAAGSPRS